MQTITITTSQNIDIDYEVAGLGERIVARLIDIGLYILLGILGWIVTLSTSIPNHGSILYGLGILAVVYILMFVFYDLLCELAMGGQSIGKRIMKIKVVSLDGGQPTFGQYLMRWLFRIVDFTLTGGLCALISVAVSEKKQRLGDMVAGTSLILTKPRTKFDHIAYAPVPEHYEPEYPQAAQLTDKEIALIQEVIITYTQTGNSEVVYTMASRIEQHLGVKAKEGMDALAFLQTVVKDYNHTVAKSDTMFNA